MGQIDGTDMYADLKVHKEAKEIPGVKIFRFEAPLYFGNVEAFKKCLAEETGLDSKELKHVQNVVQQTDLALRHEQVNL